MFDYLLFVISVSDATEVDERKVEVPSSTATLLAQGAGMYTLITPAINGGGGLCPHECPSVCGQPFLRHAWISVY